MVSFAIVWQVIQVFCVRRILTNVFPILVKTVRLVWITLMVIHAIVVLDLMESIVNRWPTTAPIAHVIMVVIAYHNFHTMFFAYARVARPVNFVKRSSMSVPAIHAKMAVSVSIKLQVIHVNAHPISLVLIAKNF